MSTIGPPYSEEPDKSVWITGNRPTPSEVEWARFAARTPHYVLSNTLTTVLWKQTRFVRSLEDIAALKRESGKDIYLIGGARTTASLIDAGLVDELRLVVYPLIAGEGKALFTTTKGRQRLELRKAAQLRNGLVSLCYGIGEGARRSPQRDEHGTRNLATHDL